MIDQRTVSFADIEGHDSVVDGGFEMVGIGEGAMGQVMCFQIAPDTLDVVELGSVSRTKTERPFRSNRAFPSNTAEAALDAAISATGVTRVLSYQAASAVKEGTQQIVLTAFEPAAMPVNLIHAHQDPLPLKVRRLLDFVAPRLRARLFD